MIDKQTSLLKELSTLYQQASDLCLLDALNSSDTEVSSEASIHLNEMGNKLNKIIIKDNRFFGDKVRVVRRGGGSSGFYPYFIGSKLIRRALHMRSPELAIEWLLKILTTESANGKSIHALWSVSVNQEILLTSDVKIVPFEELPDSPQKEALINSTLLDSFQSYLRPSCVRFFGL